MMKTLAFVILLILNLLFAETKSVYARAEKPNIIFIMVDDMGRDWLSCYGSDHQTPHIDRLAKQGLKYKNVWCMPICTPTRVTLLTGQYPFHHGWTHHYDVPRWGGAGLDWKRFTTFAKVIKSAGYTTGIGGKWQINDFRRQPDALKLHGFDEHCVWTGAERGFPETFERYWNGYLVTNGKRETVTYGPDRVNQFAIQFVQRHKEKPFLFYYPMMLTHGPFGSTPFNKKDPPVEKSDQYAGYVTYMDHLVGKLISAVDGAGIAEKTMIVLTGDNGSSAAGRLNGKKYIKGKGQRADYGAHVPFIVRAPFLIPQSDLESNDLVDFTDLFPTFVELTGAQLPDGIKLDGISLVPGLSGSEDPFRKRSWIYSQLGTFRMVRDWQFLLDNQGGFYNLEKDPLQTQNLYQSQEKINPGRRARLQKIMKTFPVNAQPPFKEFLPAKQYEAERKRAKTSKN